MTHFVNSPLALKKAFYEPALNSVGLFKCRATNLQRKENIFEESLRFHLILLPPPHTHTQSSACINKLYYCTTTPKEGRLREVLSGGLSKIRRRQRSKGLLYLFFQHRTVCHVTGYSGVSHCQNILLNLTFESFANVNNTNGMNRSRGVFAAENWYD